MDIFTLCGCAVIACVLIVTVRQQRPDIALVLTVASGVVMFIYISADLNDAVAGIYNMLGSLSSFSQEAEIMLKALGICLITQLAADICRDCGQTTVASRVELGGRAAILLLLLPLMSSILGLSEKIIDG